MKPRRPPPPPDLLEEANRQVPFGANPLSVTSLIHTTLIRGLKRIPDSPEKNRAMCQMVSELMDLMGNGADDLIVVRHRETGAQGHGNQPEPAYTPFTTDRPKP